MPQKSSFSSYPAFTFESAEFGKLLSDRMNIGMLQDAERALKEAGVSDPVDVVNMLISRLVETEGGVDLTKEMAVRLSADEREAFACAYLDSESLISKKGLPRAEGETATAYLGSNFTASVAKALAPPDWMKDIQVPKWAKEFDRPAWAKALSESPLAKQLQAPDWSKKFGRFLGDDALSALGNNEELLKRMKDFDAKINRVSISPEQMKRMEHLSGEIPKGFSAGEIPSTKRIPEMSLKDFPSEARVTNEKLGEVIGRLSELKEFEGQSVEVIRNIGVVADTLFQRFTENAIASQAAAEANNQMARDSLEASRSNVKLARGALWASLASIVVAVGLGATPIVLQQWHAPEDDKKAEATIARLLRQIDGARAGITGALQNVGVQQREAGVRLEERVSGLLDELRRSKAPIVQQRPASRRDE